MRFSLRLAIVALAAFALGGAVALLVLPGAREALFNPVRTVVTGAATIGGPFTLTDHTGKRVTDQDFRGRYMLVFFGFIFCPDICPGSLQVMTEAMERIGPKQAGKITPLFISVDHERDTPAELKEYVKSFHPRLVGLTGSATDIAAAAKAYRAIYRRVADQKSKAGYTIDHTTFFYLMGPDGKFITHFTHGVLPDVLAKRLAALP
ncbi:MAG TPA: SCO family protein [Hyphomicrobiaceae bacterium]|nr:SCO family protein [Hyphomicrobiaceae bacterium]